MNPMETDDIVLRKAKFEDWESMHKNVWSRPETAKYMQWQITKTEESAKERIRKPSLIKRRMIHTSYTKKNMVRLLALPGLRKYPHIFFRTPALRWYPNIPAKAWANKPYNYCLNTVPIL